MQPPLLAVALLALAQVSQALRISSTSCAQTQQRCYSRRALLAGGGTAVLVPGWALAAPSKGYLTMDEYNRLKAQERKDEKLYGLFEALRTRASQTDEFDRLASSEDFSGIAKLSRAWDSSVRKEVLEAANAELEPKDKERGAAINKLVLSDLKQLDRLATEKSKDQVPEASATLRKHVLEFVSLEPTRLTDKFGVGDL